MQIPLLDLRLRHVCTGIGAGDSVAGTESFVLTLQPQNSGTAMSGLVPCQQTLTFIDLHESIMEPYKVVAVAAKSAANSADAQVSRTCDLAQPVVTGSVNLAGNPKLKWEKVEGAVAYKVYRATSADGEYKLMKTVVGISYVNTNHVDGTAYSYYVVAVCKNTAGNSAASNVVKLNAK